MCKINAFNEKMLFWSNIVFEPIGVLCIFGNQYIMGRVLSCPVILRSNFFQHLMLVSTSSFLDFCVCWYVDFYLEKLLKLLQFGNTVCSTYKCKCFINGDNNKLLMKFFQGLFNIWLTQYWFCLFRFYFLF